jgi:hypothetical protein
MRRSTESASGITFGGEEIVSDESITYKSWARFELDGGLYEVADEKSTFPATHDIGEQVTVYFPPNEPQMALIGLWRSVTPFIFIGMLGAVGITAVVVYLFYFK